MSASVPERRRRWVRRVVTVVGLGATTALALAPVGHAFGAPSPATVTVASEGGQCPEFGCGENHNQVLL